jgi:hypothetical protein
MEKWRESALLSNRFQIPFQKTVLFAEASYANFEASTQLTFGCTVSVKWEMQAAGEVCMGISTIQTESSGVAKLPLWVSQGI